jgi:hypothetical protein
MNIGIIIAILVLLMMFLIACICCLITDIEEGDGKGRYMKI